MDPSNSTLTGNLSQLSGNTYTFVNPSAFAATNLAGFDLVWLDGFSLFSNLTSLTPYLNSGGRVLVQNPGFGSEPITQYPHGTGFATSFTSENSIRILAPGDFMNGGLTNANLSGWGPSAYGFFSTVPAGFTVLSDDGITGEAVTIRFNTGPGLLVYTEQGISQYLRTQSFTAGAAPLQFVENMLGAPEPGTSALLLLPFLCLLRRARSV